jgi:ribosomal protein S8
MISKVEEKNCEDNEVVLKNIDSHKRMIDYFQSLVQVGKFVYEKMNKLSEGMGSKMFKSKQNVVASK